ncbi:esterase E4-like isoform X2 [Brevipalpus obovatus]|uniref:esterase E4-like isoform X2 n=1 Tax=Brevipalpus obovatus TaxID=246614 RepID=UPI003D9DDD03
MKLSSKKKIFLGCKYHLLNVFFFTHWIYIIINVSQDLPIVSGQSPYYPQVTLSSGILRGRKMKTGERGDEKEFVAFLGIPYARPPVGPLRFQQPEQHPGWSGLTDAWTYKNPCPQLDLRGKEVGREDCLYLNVYTPTVERKPFNDFFYPVMVFMGSGNFENDDSSVFGPEKLMDKNIVLVTFNHRIGILGYLNSGDQHATGNYGLHDQLMALKWVSKNIESFLGDPHSVTLFGQRAGAASIFFHILSPLSKGLFHRVIMQSGSGLCDWSLQRNPTDSLNQLAKQLRCPSSSTSELIECARSAPWKDILKAQKNDKAISDMPAFYVPSIEKFGSERFLPQDPWTILDSGVVNRVPIIIGFNKQETSYLYPALSQQYAGEKAKFHDKMVNKFLECCTPFKGKAREKILPIILFQYFSRLNPTNHTEVLLRFINMTTDSMYISCIDETLHALSRVGLSPYLYSFSYRGQHSMIETVKGSATIPTEIGPSSGDELLYLFHMKLGFQRNQNFRDEKVSHRLTTLWTDFVRFGLVPRVPNAEYPKWEKFDAQHQTLLSIDDYLTIQPYNHETSALFWSDHLRNLSGTEKSGSRGRLGYLARPYKTLAWAMIGVSTSLMVLVIFLLSILFYQKRMSSSSNFRSAPENGSSHLSTTSSGLY